MLGVAPTLERMVSMAVSIRLSRHGKRNCPFYRLVVADRERPRDGKFIEVVGTYDPRANGGIFTAKRDRIAYWVGKGAQPSDTVSELLKQYPS